MSKKNQGIIYIVSGILLPTMSWFIADWYDVKIKQIQSNDFIGWIIWFILSAPLIFTGIYKLTGKKTLSVLFVLLSLFLLAIVDIFLVLNFHFWIGGSN